MSCPIWSASSTPAEEVFISAGVIRVHQFTLRKPKATIDHGTLKTWHDILFSQVVPLRYYAGNFRGTNPRYPCLNVLVAVAGKRGTDQALVESAMRSLGSDLQALARDLDFYLLAETRPEYQVAAKLFFVAGMIGTLIKVHPFINGNGRVSRLLANHLCHRYGLPMPFSDPSPRPSQAMYSIAGSAAMDGDFVPLFTYLFDALQGRLPK